MRLGFLLPVLLLLPFAALADDFVRAKGRLSDADFHQLVACGRPPGGKCQVPMRRWPDGLAQDLTVTRLPEIERVSPVTVAQVNLALDRAIAELNGVGAAFRLRRVADNEPAHIRLSIRSPRSLSFITNETQAKRLPAGLVTFASGPSGQIAGATILISSGIALTETNSVVLEELTQSLGLVFDIQNPQYKRRSIFAQDSNSVTTITGQDASALRLHYPPSP